MRSTCAAGSWTGWGGSRGPRPFMIFWSAMRSRTFADIQLALIFRLVRSPEGLVLAGDTKQIINPSGFRWEEVRNKFYERGIQVPRVHALRINFRCVGNVVKLANALLDLKQRLVGLTGSELREEWKFNGRPPFLLTGLKEQDLLAQLLIRAAGQVILVRDRKEQTRLKKALATELVFTIQEAKGLEFDTVLLWKFSADPKSAPLWRRVCAGGALERGRQPHLRHEINLLYVAITRARNTLILYDPAAEIWELPALGELLFRTSDQEALPRLWHRVSTPEEWEGQGDYFLEREYYPAALECYKNAGNLDRAEIAQAFVHEQRKEFREAGPLFEKHGYGSRAGDCYERSGMWEQALGVWEKLKDRERGGPLPDRSVRAAGPIRPGRGGVAQTEGSGQGPGGLAEGGRVPPPGRIPDRLETLSGGGGSLGCRAACTIRPPPFSRK